MASFASCARFALAGAGSSLALLLLPRARSDAEQLRSWGMGASYDHLNRTQASALPPSHRVLVVLGITGAGKSCTANMLAGRQHKTFPRNSGIVSVTQAAAHRDYAFVNEQWRVVDTPGLCDTSRAPQSVRGEIERIARFAPHGVSAFIIVVPRGRFTQQHEDVLRQLVAMFGQGILRHSIVAVTSATDPHAEGGALLTRDAMVEEINLLPLHHYFRDFVEACQMRVVPIENLIEPHKYVSRMTLHQRVLDLEAATGGARFMLAAQPVGEEALGAPFAGTRFYNCQQSYVIRPGKGPLLRIECEAAAGLGAGE
jgi:hypothetical protein